jgi:hypothetical protein
VNALNPTTQRELDKSQMDLAELETTYLTKLMKRDAKVWWRYFYGGGQQALDEDSKNQDEELKTRALA